MIRPVIRDVMFLARKSVPADRGDTAAAQDLFDTLQASRDRCAGMAANMIGVSKRIIVVNTGLTGIIMFNPVILRHDTPYDTMEGCLSLDGMRPARRYRNIEVEYYDSQWQRHRQKFSGYAAQVIQHEIDHLNGIII